MGFGEPKYVGHCAFRGLGCYPEGQPFQKNVNYIYGRELRAGYVHVSSTKVYWFICFNSPSLGIQYWYFSFCIITTLLYYVCQSLLYYVCACIRPTSNNWLSIYASHCWTISLAFLRKSQKNLFFNSSARDWGLTSSFTWIRQSIHSKSDSSGGSLWFKIFLETYDKIW